MKRAFVAVTALLGLACSSGAERGDGGDDAAIVPAGLTITALPGGNGVLEVIAFTLRDGPSGAELYAAVKNVGDTPACAAGLGVELFDETDQSLAIGINGLLTKHFYRLTDGSGALAACVGPGDVTMAWITVSPSEVAIEDVARVVYRCSYFALDVVAAGGLAISQVKSVTRSTGTAYTGTLTNSLDVAVSDPSVTVFPLNRVGRPLGVAIGSGSGEIPPRSSWAFETEAVSVPGVDYAAYPAGALGD